MDGLSKQVQETEQARIKDQEENWKKLAELEAKLELLLGLECSSGEWFLVNCVVSSPGM